jgi:uncharacterized protein YegP (UPF0339 family)
MNRPPKAKDNTMMYIIIAVVVCCCCCCIISSATGGFAAMMGGESPAPASPATQSQPSGGSGGSGGGFQIGASKDTGFNDESRQAFFLDRHNVNCDPNGINSFKLVRSGKGKFRYDYKCSSKGALGPLSSKDTGFNDEGGGNVIYLDRHNVDCGTGALSQFNLTRDGKGKYRYNYKCASSNKPLQCRDVTTPVNDHGGGDTIYLDRHNISCNNDEVISKFKLMSLPGNKIQYSYKCCKQ